MVAFEVGIFKFYQVYLLIKIDDGALFDIGLLFMISI